MQLNVFIREESLKCQCSTSSGSFFSRENDIVSLLIWCFTWEFEKYLELLF